MPPIQFEFSRQPFGQVSGFDMGGISIKGELLSVSSSGPPSDQPMMVYLSIVELLIGVAKLCLAPGSGRYEFIGTDSSFSLIFESTLDGSILVKRRKALVEKVDRLVLLVALRDSVTDFLSTNGNELPPSDAVSEDLNAAREMVAASISSLHS